MIRVNVRGSSGVKVPSQPILPLSEGELRSIADEAIKSHFYMFHAALLPGPFICSRSPSSSGSFSYSAHTDTVWTLMEIAYSRAGLLRDVPQIWIICWLTSSFRLSSIQFYVWHQNQNCRTVSCSSKDGRKSLRSWAGNKCLSSFYSWKHAATPALNLTCFCVDLLFEYHQCFPDRRQQWAPHSPLGRGVLCRIS